MNKSPFCLLRLLLLPRQSYLPLKVLVAALLRWFLERVVDLLYLLGVIEYLVVVVVWFVEEFLPCPTRNDILPPELLLLGHGLRLLRWGVLLFLLGCSLNEIIHP